MLRLQVGALSLDSYGRVIGLGDIERRQAIKEAFGLTVELEFPFAGLELGYSLQAAKVAVVTARRT